MSDSARQRVQELIDGLAEEEKEILSQVLQAERAKLYMSSPRGIIEELEAIVRNVIK